MDGKMGCGQNGDGSDGCDKPDNNNSYRKKKEKEKKVKINQKNVNYTF